jgi:hypothetical protein
VTTTALTTACKRFLKISLSFLKLVLFLLFAGAILVDTRRWLGEWAVAARILGVLSAVLMTHRYTTTSFKDRVRASHHPPTFTQVPDSRAKQILEEIQQESRITLNQAEVFTRAIVETTELHQRIVEEYRPNRRTLRKKVNIDVQIPTHIMDRDINRAEETDASVGTFLYPVVVPPKGVFYDDLCIRDADGHELPILSYREYLHVAVNVIHFLLGVACDTPPNELPADAVACEHDAVWGVISRIDGRPPGENPPSDGQTVAAESGHRAHSAADVPAEDGQEAPTSEDVEQAGRELARLVQTLRTVSSHPDRRRAIRMAAQLVEVLSTHYAIVVAAPVPASGRFAISYECTAIPELDLASGLKRGHSMPGRFIKRLHEFKTRLYIFLSTRPVDVKLSLDNAWTCQSYHVLVHCPDSLYLTHQELVVPDHYLERTARRSPTLPHVRFRRRLGQPYAHLYARFLPTPRRAVIKHGKIARPAERAPKLLLHFHEVPPGSVCSAALAAIASTVLVWIIGYGLSHGNDPVLSTETPALLLAFPGVAASWLGFDGDIHLFEGTLTARLSLACTAVISLIATGLYVLHHEAAGSKIAHALHTAHSVVGILGITLWPWAALTIVGVFNSSYLAYRWSINSWRFRYLADRPDPAGMVAKVRQEHEDEEEHQVAESATHQVVGLQQPTGGSPGTPPAPKLADN